MGWFKDLTDWGKRVLPLKKAEAVATYSYQTMAYLFEQVGVIPKVIHSMVTHAPNRTLATHLTRIALEDLLPLVLVRYTSELLQQYLYRRLAEEDPDSSTHSFDTVIMMALYSLQLATWTYEIRKKTKILVRTVVVTLEAPVLLNADKIGPKMDVCTLEHCSMLRFMQGSIRDNAAYWATEAAISLIGYIPYVGGAAAASLAVYHRGRYVLTIVLPDLCNRHQVVYLREHSELALSLGLGHTGSTWLTLKLIETATGIPQAFYASLVESLLLFTQMNTAAHMMLPPAKKASLRNIPDPILHFQNVVGFVVDIFILGLKSKIPRMLKERGGKNLKAFLKDLPLGEIVARCDWLLHNRLSRLVLPDLIQSKDLFLKDPVVGSNLPGLRKTVINILTEVEGLPEYLAIRIAGRAPDAAASLLESILGTPKFATKLLLELISDQEIIEQIRYCRYQIQGLDVSIPVAAVTVDDTAVLLNGQTQVDRDNKVKPILLAPSTEFAKSPAEVIKRTKEPDTPLLVDRERAIKRSAVSAGHPAWPVTSTEARLAIRNRFHKPANAPSDEDEAEWVDVQSVVENRDIHYQ